MTSPSPRPSVSSPGHRQRGAAAVFAAISLLAMLSMMALAIDVGRLYFAQRDLQRLANLAALDSVRVASGCAATGRPGSLAAATAEVLASLSRNQQAGSSIANLTQQTLVGRVTSAAGSLRSFEALADADARRDAVQVVLTRQTPARLLPLITGDGQNTLSVVAVAQQPTEARFSVGTNTVSLSGGLVNNTLAGLLCRLGDTACQTNVINLNVASSMSGLVSTQVTVEQLATAVGLNVEDLSNPTNLDGTVILGGGSGVISRLGSTLGGGVSGLVSQLGGLASNDSPVPLRQFLDPVLGVLSPDTPVINLFDLLMALGQAANASSGVQSIELPNVEAAVPSIAGLPGVEVRTFLRVLEAPKIGYGKVGSATATANNAQVRLEVRASVSTGALSVVVASLGGTLSNPLNIGIDVTAAQSTATLESIQCPASDTNNGMPIAAFEVDNSVANIDVGTFTGTASSGPALIPASAIPLLTLPSIPILLPGGLNLQLGINAALGTSSGDSTPEFRDFQQETSDTRQEYFLACGGSNPDCTARTAYPNPATIGTAVSVQSLNISLASVPSNSCPPLNLVCIAVRGTLQVLIGLVDALVNTVLTPLANFLATLLINPLLEGLGVGLDGATLTMTAVQVTQPQIVTQSLGDAN